MLFSRQNCEVVYKNPGWLLLCSRQRKKSYKNKERRNEKKEKLKARPRPEVSKARDDFESKRDVCKQDVRVRELAICILGTRSPDQYHQF